MCICPGAQSIHVQTIERIVATLTVSYPLLPIAALLRADVWQHLSPVLKLSYRSHCEYFHGVSDQPVNINGGTCSTMGSDLQPTLGAAATSFPILPTSKNESARAGDGEMQLPGAGIVMRTMFHVHLPVIQNVGRAPQLFDGL